ncbi:hypothetical protein GUY61_18775, partial [Streptomyces sp. GC420]|nr:hypothetical protein [Streptomyces sp. GC420]
MTVVDDYGSLQVRPYVDFPGSPSEAPPFPGPEAPVPATQDLGLFTHAQDPAEPETAVLPRFHGGRADRRRRAKRPMGAFVAAGAVVAVLGVGALAAGSLGGSEEDESLPNPRLTESLPVLP